MKTRRDYFAMALPILLAGTLCRADDIVGVQPAALDQPRIYLNLRRSQTAEPFVAKADGQSQAAIEAFLDTGASALVLSDESFKALGVNKQSLQDAKVVEYEEVGVGGSEKCFVSEPIFFSFAPYSSTTDGDNPNSYSAPAGPVRAELRPSGGFLEMFTGGLDVAGMPVMASKVVVIDPKPLNTFTDKLRTTIVAADDARIPKVTRHVPLCYVSFDRFARVTATGSPPTTSGNPMIGPDPFKPHDPARPVVARYGNKTAKLTMLLDTGAVCSMISRKHAALLGVKYSADEKKLLGVPEKQQFTLTIGGIGGNKSAVGFYVDHLTLPVAKDEQPIVYGKAPVLVSDISLVDPQTQQTFTLDGVFGMNFLVASANVTGGLLPDIGQLTEGPFTTIVVDHSRGFLGLTPR